MITVTAAIIRTGDAVLITRRKPGQRMAGYWEFPGGKLEDGETLQTCLEREIHEELGLNIQAGMVVATNVHTYDHGDIYLVAIEATIRSGSPILTAHDDLAWVPVSCLLEYQLAPADIPIAKALINKQSSNHLLPGIAGELALHCGPALQAERHLPMTGPRTAAITSDQSDNENSL
jgi:8-oxo-dGTP diphosphatase